MFSPHLNQSTMHQHKNIHYSTFKGSLSNEYDNFGAKKRNGFKVIDEDSWKLLQSWWPEKLTKLIPFSSLLLSGHLTVTWSKRHSWVGSVIYRVDSIIFTRLLIVNVKMFDEWWSPRASLGSYPSPPWHSWDDQRGVHSSDQEGFCQLISLWWTCCSGGLIMFFFWWFRREKRENKTNESQRERACWWDILLHILTIGSSEGGEEGQAVDDARGDEHDVW